MKKLLALILVFAMILCSLVSCGNSIRNNDEEETAPKKTYKFDNEENHQTKRKEAKGRRNREVQKTTRK